MRLKEHLNPRHCVETKQTMSTHLVTASGHITRVAITLLFAHLLIYESLGAEQASVTPEHLIARTTIPYVQGPYTLPVTIANTSYLFVVDTGAAFTYIDRSLSRSLSPIQEGEPAKDDSYWVRARIALGKRDFVLEKAVCRDLSSLRSTTGLPLMGILGMDFLGDKILHIDVDRRVLQILDGHDVNSSEWEHALDIRVIGDGHPYIELAVNAVPVQLLIDTGSAGTIELDERAFERVKRDRPSVSVVVPNAIGTLDGREVGNSYLESTTTTIGKFTAEGIVVSGLPPSHSRAIVGNLFLCRFNAKYDFANRKVYVTRSSLFKARDCTDCCGIVVEHMLTGIFALGIGKGSPADQSHILPGDEIVGIGGVSIQSHGARSVVKELSRPRTEDVVIALRRHGELISVTIDLTPNK